MQGAALLLYLLFIRARSWMSAIAQIMQHNTPSDFILKGTQAYLF